MANIMITGVCNVKCPYCFADEFVNNQGYLNDKNKHISIENFERAVNFILTNPRERIGIIGGEPTLHPQFKEFIEKLIFDKRVSTFTLFTNGVDIEDYYRLLSNDKIRILINCNSPSDIGQNKYDMLVKNVDNLINNYYMKDRITLGINMYKPDFEYDYIIELLEKYNYRNVRTSITVLNAEARSSMSGIEYFNIMKNSVFKFFSELERRGIVPSYDCNLMPNCIPNNEETEFLRRVMSHVTLDKNSRRRTNLLGPSKCQPVIDILPDLNSVRCFGLSDQHKVHISKFRHIDQLRNYFYNYFDSFVYNISDSENCAICDQRKNMECNGGCLVYKLDKIESVRNYCKSL